MESFFKPLFKMKRKLIDFAEFFQKNAREIPGLHADFCLRTKLREYSFFYPLLLAGLRWVYCVESEYVDDPLAGRDGYTIKKSEFSKIK